MSKGKTMKNLLIRFTDEQHDKLFNVAHDKRDTMTGVVRKALEVYFKKHDKYFNAEAKKNLAN